MQTTGPSDSDFLTEWLRDHREPAFHALVARYAGLVHMAAKRTTGDEGLAAEASQLTFILLARKAKSLASRSSLAGWLHLTAVMQAKNLLRQNRREICKRQHLLTAMETHEQSHISDRWQEMQPVLDDALAALSEKDREALLLRFYRSLTVREVATTLGIATDAAQKRIDRATDRLRGKLAKRGCQAGGSLGTAMVAGFAADAQAAAIAVPLLASKAIAVSLVSSGFVSTTSLLATATLIKWSPIIVPLVALLVAGTLLANQRLSLAALARQNALLQSRLAEDDARSKFVTAANLIEPINWKETARQFAELNRRNSLDAIQLMPLRQRLSSMGKEEIISAMDEISQLNHPREVLERMQNILTAALIEKDPEAALNRFISHWDGRDAGVSLFSAPAIRKWAEANAAKATAWLDQQIAAGKFDSNSLDERSQPRNQFEAALASFLLSKDPDAVGRRLATLPPESAKEVISNLSYMTLPEDSQLEWANLVRGHWPKEEGLEIIVQQVFRKDPNAGYSSVTEYMDRINASPAERTACIEQAAIMTFAIRTWSGEITGEDMDRLEEWINAQAPGETGRVMGIALAGRSFNPGNFSKAADLAIQYRDASGSDDVLVSFLSSDVARGNKEQAGVLAEKIADEKIRKKVLRKLQGERNVIEVPIKYSE